MKLRSLFVFGAGIAAGLAIARKLAEDDPAVLTGPSTAQRPANRTLRLASNSAAKLGDRATVMSLGAIRRARGAIRDRLGDDVDDAAWN